MNQNRTDTERRTHTSAPPKVSRPQRRKSWRSILQPTTFVIVALLVAVASLSLILTTNNSNENQTQSGAGPPIQEPAQEQSPPLSDESRNNPPGNERPLGQENPSVVEPTVVVLPTETPTPSPTPTVTPAPTATTTPLPTNTPRPPIGASNDFSFVFEGRLDPELTPPGIPPHLIAYGFRLKPEEVWLNDFNPNDLNEGFKRPLGTSMGRTGKDPEIIILYINPNTGESVGETVITFVLPDDRQAEALFVPEE